ATTTTGVVRNAQAPFIVAKSAITVSSAKPDGSSSVPGRRTRAARSRSSPQPSESAARSSGNANQGTSRLLNRYVAWASLRNGSDPLRRDEPPRGTRLGVEHLDLVPRPAEGDVHAPRGRLLVVDRDSPPGQGDLRL